MSEYETIWDFKLTKYGFKFTKLVREKPMTIETNVSDDSEFAKWRNGKTAELNETFKEVSSAKRLKAS